MAEAIERFVFDGKIYYRQYRKCARPDCKCQSRQPTDMHGPYWYSKFDRGAVTHYVGKELPAHVSRARERYKLLAVQIEAEATKQRARLAALEKLIARGTLTPDDEKALKRWGIKA